MELTRTACVAVGVVIVLLICLVVSQVSEPMTNDDKKLVSRKLNRAALILHDILNNSSKAICEKILNLSMMQIKIVTSGHYSIILEYTL